MKQAKQTVLIMTAIFAFILISAFTGSYLDKQDKPKTGATVTQDQGINIFILCVPTSDYINLGTVKVKLTMSGSPSELYNKALKKCKSEYPQADGLIFSSIDLDKAEAIKFK